MVTPTSTNAENAADTFAQAPSGELSTYDPPGAIGVRVDHALGQGDDLLTDYDLMIAKLIVNSSDREKTPRPIGVLTAVKPEPPSSPTERPPASAGRILGGGNEHWTVRGEQH